jgi:hypothetical protein
MRGIRVGIAIFQGIRSGVSAPDLCISDRAAAETHIIGHSDMVDTTASSMLCGYTRTHQKFPLLLTRSRFVRRLILGLSRKGLSFRITIPSVNMHDVTKHYRSVICLSLIPRNCPKRHRAPQLSRLGKSSSPQLVNEGFSIEAETNGLGRSALG